MHRYWVLMVFLFSFNTKAFAELNPLICEPIFSVALSNEPEILNILNQRLSRSLKPFAVELGQNPSAYDSLKNLTPFQWQQLLSTNISIFNDRINERLGRFNDQKSEVTEANASATIESDLIFIKDIGYVFNGYIQSLGFKTYTLIYKKEVSRVINDKNGRPEKVEINYIPVTMFLIIPKDVVDVETFVKTYPLLVYNSNMESDNEFYNAEVDITFGGLQAISNRIRNNDIIPLLNRPQDPLQIN